MKGIDIRITASIKHKTEQHKEFSYQELKKVEDFFLMFEQIKGLNFKYQIACDRNYYREIKENMLKNDMKNMPIVESKDISHVNIDLVEQEKKKKEKENFEKFTNSMVSEAP